MALLRYASGPGRLALLATVLGSGIAFIDGTVVAIALPHHRPRPRRGRRRAAVDRQRLHAHARLVHPPRRVARRPVRASPGLRRRRGVVRRRVAAVRPRAELRHARRRAGPAGHRRRAPHAGSLAIIQSVVPPRRPHARDRRLVRARGARRRGRAVPRRLARRCVVAGAGSSSSTCRSRRSSCSSRCGTCPRPRDADAAAPPDVAGTMLGALGLAGPPTGSRPGPRAAARPRGRRRARRRPGARWSRSSWSSARRSTRSCRCTCSAPRAVPRDQRRDVPRLRRAGRRVLLGRRPLQVVAGFGPLAAGLALLPVTSSCCCSRRAAGPRRPDRPADPDDGRSDRVRRRAAPARRRRRRHDLLGRRLPRRGAPRPRALPPGRAAHDDGARARRGSGTPASRAASTTRSRGPPRSWPSRSCRWSRGSGTRWSTRVTLAPAHRIAMLVCVGLMIGGAVLSALFVPSTFAAVRASASDAPGRSSPSPARTSRPRDRRRPVTRAVGRHAPSRAVPEDPIA